MKHLTKYIVFGILILACLVYLLTRCSIFQGDTHKKPTKEADSIASVTENDEIQEMINGMSLEDKIYQMFVVTPEQLTGVGEVIQAGEATRLALQEKKVGGIVYFAKNIQTAEQTKEMLENTQGFSEIPLFMAVDEEGGIVSRIGSNPQMGMEKIEPMGEIGASKNYDRAQEAGSTIGNEMKILGFNVDFAPVADVLNGDNVIGNRSFGRDAELVGEMVSRFIEGLDESGISATLKHFPGQGSTYGDTHYNYVETDRTENQIREEELLPFKKGIESGADFIMVGHMTVKAFDADEPATFSKRIITELLKEEMGFKGIVITDALNMGAILNTYTSGDAAIKVVKAGADMLLMPNDLDAAVDALYKAVRSGEISENRINKSVARILEVKKKRGLI